MEKNCRIPVNGAAVLFVFSIKIIIQDDFTIFIKFSTHGFWFVLL